jgi:hypothetical protein
MTAFLPGVDAIDDRRTATNAMSGERAHHKVNA